MTQSPGMQARSIKAALSRARGELIQAQRSRAMAARACAAAYLEDRDPPGSALDVFDHVTYFKRIIEGLELFLADAETALLAS